MTNLTIPEYEYLTDTPTTGGWTAFLTCLANEAQYLAGEAGVVPDHFEVGCDHWGAGTVRYLINADTGERIDQT